MNLNRRSTNAVAAVLVFGLLMAAYLLAGGTFGLTALLVAAVLAVASIAVATRLLSKKAASHIPGETGQR